MTYESLLEQVKEKNYAEVPFGLSQEELHAAAELFLDFLRLPDEVKAPVHYRVIPDNRGTNVGWLRKSQATGDTDNKEYFHYHASAPQRFKEHMHIPEFAALMKVAENIYEHASRSLKTVLAALSEKHPGLTEKFFQDDKQPRFFLRFLKYDVQDERDFLATAHYDRGSCTLALAESSPGLRIGKNHETLREVRRSGDQVLFMPALRFEDVTSPLFTPAWHDVVQKRENALDNKIARWAIVFFADSHDLENITFEQAHTIKE